MLKGIQRILKGRRPNIERLFKPFANPRIAGLFASTLVFGIGLTLYLPSQFQLGTVVRRASYDWSFDVTRFIRPDIGDSEVVLIYMDESSYNALDQPFTEPWDRALHAQLLRRLTNDGVKAVAFDIIFTEDGPDPEADKAFEDAIRESGRVIMAADLSLAGNLDYGAINEITPPFDPFLIAAGDRWGFARLQYDQDYVVRQHFHGIDSDRPSLTWAIAQFLDLPVTRQPDNHSRERWSNYYGGPVTIPHVSYYQALFDDGVPEQFFRDKTVLIGARPMAKSYLARNDEARSSYSTWRKEFVFMPAVEVHATHLLNLIRGDWLSRPAPAVEWLMLILVAVVFGFGLSQLRPVPAAILAAAGCAAIVVATGLAFAIQRVWVPWLIAVGFQIPFALMLSVLFHSIEWYIQKRRLERERQRAESRIREQAALLDKAQDAIMVHDLDWRVTYWNKSAERLYGWSQIEMAGNAVTLNFFKPGDSSLTKARDEVLSRGEWIGELQQPTKSGSEIIVQSRWTLVRDSLGNPTAILVINTDITESKKLEAQLLRTQRMESIGTLAGGIAHDLNNVLAPIMMGVQLLRMKPLQEEDQTMLKSMESSVRRGVDMVKQVLTFARGHEGEKKVIQMKHIVSEMNKIMRETFPKSIETKSRVGANLAPIMGDATQLHQVLLNFCVNARDAMPDGGSILVSADNVTVDDATAHSIHDGKPGEFVCLSVSDSGTGIPPEIRDRIFEPFFTTKEVGKGTGLGLSTTISIVKNHGGFLDLESELGSGATFKVYLPVAASGSTLEETPTSTNQLRGRKEWILVVDDEEAIRKMTQFALQCHGYQVLVAANGQEAVDLCQRHKHRLTAVLIDMMMPVMDGSTAILTMKQLKPDLRFIATSGLMQTEKIQKEIGTDRITFLPKPFTNEKLLEILRNLIDAPPDGDGQRTDPTDKANQLAAA